MIINLVIMPISIESGMAGTVLLRNHAKYLPKQDVAITNMAFDLEEKTESRKDWTILSYPYHSRNLLRRIPTWFQAITALKRIRKKNEKNIILYYDVVHTPFFLFLIVYARLVLKYKVVFDVVEDYMTKKRNLGLRGNLRLVFSGRAQRKLNWLGDGVICISAYLFNSMKPRMKSKPVLNLPISFDPVLLAQSKKTGNDNAAIRIFYGGTFGEKDGIDYLVEAFVKARNDHPEFTLVLTGKASRTDHGKLMKILNNCVHKESIQYLGFLSYEDYLVELSKAHILCMTRTKSAFANAGFPFKLGEYLATGKAVVVSRIKEVERYLSEQDCVFVEPESSDDIARAFVQLRNVNVRNEVGKNGYEKALLYFDARKVALDLYHFLETV